MSTDLDQKRFHSAQHFNNVACNYHADSLIVSPLSPHGQWLSSLIFDALDLKPGHIFVDIGCGSGDKCLWFLRKMKNQIKTIGCDPSPTMIEIFNREVVKEKLINYAQGFCMDALTFSQQKQLPKYNRLLMKECIHLIPPTERLLTLKGLAEQFNAEDNKLVIATRPAKATFPFDERTTEIYISQCLPIDTYVKELEMCGFTNTKCDTCEYTYDDSVTLDDWLNFIRNRTWSTFSPELINEEQMNDLITHLKETYKHKKFQLRDEFIILQCSKNNH